MNPEPLDPLSETEMPYDESRDNTLRAMIGEFYSRRMTSIVVLVWGLGLLFMAGAVACAVAFFKAGQTREQILYATGFLLLMQWLSSLKIFAWQTIHRNSLKREIKRLELRLQRLDPHRAG